MSASNDDTPLGEMAATNSKASPAPSPASSPSPITNAAASVSYSDEEEMTNSDAEQEEELRRAADPFARTARTMAAANAVPAPRAKSEAPARAKAFWDAMSAPSGIIDEGIVRKYVFDYGTPEQPAGARALLWKLLLGYLPWDRNQWADSLKRNRATYESFVQELTANPFAGMEEALPLPVSPPTSKSPPNKSSAGSASSSAASSSSIKTNLRMTKLSAADDPLSSSQASTWTSYYKDNSIRDEIEKDVRRTYSTFHFFQERVNPLVTTAEEVRRVNLAEKAKLAASERQQAADNAKAQSSFFSPNKPPAERPNLFSDDGISPSHSKVLSPHASTGSAANLFDEFAMRQNTVAKASSVPEVTSSSVEVASGVGKRASDENHHDVIKRILFVYAKLNPGIRYVQGMNEILAPVYYVFAHNGTQLQRHEHGEPLADDPIEKSSRGLFGVETAEADAFFCFTAIMSHMRDRFCKALDTSPTGVLNVIAHVNTLLQRVDYQLWEHLQSIGVDPRFYSFRWITLILSQEFELPDVLRLWDSLFAAEPEASLESVDAASPSHSYAGVRKGTSPPAPGADDSANKKIIVEFLNDCCCAMLCMVRRPLLEADFSTALKLLQSAGQGLDVQRVLFKAQEIMRIRRAGGGYVSVAPQPAGSPPPLASFTAATPRPGEEHAGANGPAAQRKGFNIALLDAIKGAMPSLASKGKPPATQAPPAHSMDERNSAASNSRESASISPASSSSSSSSSAPVGLAASASAAAASLGHLVAHGVQVAGSAGIHAVESAVHSGAALAAAAVGAASPNRKHNVPPQPVPIEGDYVHVASEAHADTEEHAQPAEATEPAEPEAAAADEASSSI